jgi:hypothetical protein
MGNVLLSEVPQGAFTSKRLAACTGTVTVPVPMNGRPGSRHSPLRSQSPSRAVAMLMDFHRSAGDRSVGGVTT